MMNFLSETIKEEDEEADVKGPLRPSNPIPPYETPGPGPSNDSPNTTCSRTSCGIPEIPVRYKPLNVTSADALLMDLFEQHPSILKNIYDDTSSTQSETPTAVVSSPDTQPPNEDAASAESESKIVQEINEYMESYKTIEDKLTAVCQRYMGVVNEKTKLESAVSRTAREMNMLRCQKEQLLTKYDRVVRVRDRMKIVCQSLQLQIKSLKEETIVKLSEEHEKCMSVIASIKAESAVGNDTKDKVLKLEQANGELATKCGRISAENEAQRKQIGKMELRIRLETQLNMAKRKKMKLEMDAERENMMSDNARMFKELHTAESKIKDLTKEIVGKVKSVDHHENCIFQMNHLRDENFKLRDKLSRVEKDAVSWNTLWNKSQKTLVEMKAKRYKERDDALRLEEQLEMVQNVCRSLQAERFRLLDKIRKLSVDGGIRPIFRDHEETRLPLVRNEVFRNPFSLHSESVHGSNPNNGGDTSPHRADKSSLTQGDNLPERIVYSPQNVPEKCVDKNAQTSSNTENETKVENNVAANLEAVSSIPPQTNLKGEVNMIQLSKSIENFMKTLVSNGFTFDKVPVKSAVKSIESFAVYHVVDVDIPPPPTKKHPVRNLRKNFVFNVKEKYSSHKNKLGRIGDAKQNVEKTNDKICGISSEDRVRNHMKGLTVCIVNDFDIPPVIQPGIKDTCATGRPTIDNKENLSLAQKNEKFKDPESQRKEIKPRLISGEPQQVSARLVRSLNVSSNKEEKSKPKLASQSEKSSINKVRPIEYKNPYRQGFAHANENVVDSFNEVAPKISVKALVDNFNNINKVRAKPSFRTLVDRHEAFSSDCSSSSTHSFLTVGDYFKLDDNESFEKATGKGLCKNPDRKDEVEESKSLKELASLVQSLFNFSKQLKSEGQTIQSVFQTGVLPKEYDTIRNISSATFQEIKKEANNIAQILRMEEIKNDRLSASVKAVERLERLAKDNVEIAKEVEVSKDEVKLVECLKKEMREEMGKLMEEKMCTFHVILKPRNYIIYTISDIGHTQVQWLRIERYVNGYPSDSEVSKDTSHIQGHHETSDEKVVRDRKLVGDIRELCSFGEAKVGGYDICSTLRNELRSSILEGSEKVFHGAPVNRCNVTFGPVNVEKCFERHANERKSFPVVIEQCVQFINEESPRITKGQIEWLPIVSYMNRNVVQEKVVPELQPQCESLERNDHTTLSIIPKPYKSENLHFIKDGGGELDNITRKNSTHREWLLIEKSLPLEATSHSVRQVETECDKISAGQIEWLSVEERSSGVIAIRDSINEMKMKESAKREWFVVDRSSTKKGSDDHIDKFSSKMAIGHIKWLPIKDSTGCLDTIHDICSNLQIGQRQWCLLERTVSADGSGNTAFVEEQQWYLYDKTLAGDRMNYAVGEIKWHPLPNAYNNNRVRPVDDTVHARYQNVISELVEKHSEISLKEKREYANQLEKEVDRDIDNREPVVDTRRNYNLPNHNLYPDQGLGVKNLKQNKTQAKESDPVAYYIPAKSSLADSDSNEKLTGNSVPEKLRSDMYRREVDAHRRRIVDPKDRMYEPNEWPTRFSTSHAKLPSVTSEPKNEKKKPPTKPKKKRTSFIQKLCQNM